MAAQRLAIGAPGAQRFQDSGPALQLAPGCAAGKFFERHESLLKALHPQEHKRLHWYRTCAALHEGDWSRSLFLQTRWLLQSRAG